MHVELLDRQKYKTRIELANVMFDYLEIWHNRNSFGVNRSSS